MRKRKVDPREELEQYQAYGEYSYSYRHAAEDRRSQARDGQVDAQAANRPLDAMEPEPFLSPEEALRLAQEKARRRSRSITNRLIILLVLTIGTIIFLQSTVYRLKTVHVLGNVTKTPQQIAAASGLVKGLNIFSISEEEIRRNLSTDHTVIFLGCKKDYPDTITLYISEREAVAATQWLGLLYTLDAQGIVMEEFNTLDRPSDMPSIIGLQVTNVHVGQKLEVRNREQLQAYFDIMEELKQQLYRDQIVEMNLSDSDDLYLLTKAGISVRLGNRTEMRAKIGALRTDIAYLQQLGKTTGVLDVTIPVDAKYRPES